MKKILVVIGETSGDMHAGKVLTAIQKINPQLKFIGTGGVNFQKISQKVYYKAEEMEVIGWWEVLKNYKFLKTMFQKITSLLDHEKPDALFLVDYVGFNLRLAREAKKRAIPVYFYIAPQVWAWKKNRVLEIAQNIKKLIVLFPFEVEFFAKENISVECFGHPLLKIAKKTNTKTAVFQKYGLTTHKKLVCLFGGSRKQELVVHLPKIIQTAKILAKKQDLQFVFVLASEKQRMIVEPFCCVWTKKNIQFIAGDFYDLAGRANLALACSGTVTLELAILEIPTIIFYHTSLLNFFLAKYCFGIKRLGLPNIVCNENWLPELIQYDFQPQKLAKIAIEILQKGEQYQKISKNFPKFKEKLSGKTINNKGAYQQTAEFLAKQWR